MFAAIAEQQFSFQVMVFIIMLGALSPSPAIKTKKFGQGNQDGLGNIFGNQDLRLHAVERLKRDDVIPTEDSIVEESLVLVGSVTGTSS